MNTVLIPARPFHPATFRPVPSPLVPSELTSPSPRTDGPLVPRQLTSWTPPEWTDTVWADGELVVSSRLLGSVPDPANAADDVQVLIVQRDEIRADSSRVEVLRHPVEILVGGVSLSRPQAQTLNRLVDDAITFTADPA